MAGEEDARSPVRLRSDWTGRELTVRAFYFLLSRRIRYLRMLAVFGPKRNDVVGDGGGGSECNKLSPKSCRHLPRVETCLKCNGFCLKIIHRYLRWKVFQNKSIIYIQNQGLDYIIIVCYNNEQYYIIVYFLKINHVFLNKNMG